MFIVQSERGLAVCGVIELMADEKRRRQLFLKLVEYTMRQRGIMSVAQFRDSAYKSGILKRLLKHGRVDVQCLASEIGVEINDPTYVNACVVINDYNETGGLNNSGGTGLHRI